MLILCEAGFVERTFISGDVDQLRDIKNRLKVQIPESLINEQDRFKKDILIPVIHTTVQTQKRDFFDRWKKDLNSINDMLSKDKAFALKKEKYYTYYLERKKRQMVRNEVNPAGLFPRGIHSGISSTFVLY